MSARLAILLHADQRGGAERAMRVLAGTLGVRGKAVDLVLLTGAELGNGLPHPSVRPVVLGAHRVATSVPRLARYLARTRPAAMVSALTHANVAAIAARRLSGVDTRVVVVEHCLLSQLGVAAHRRRDSLQPWFAARLYRHADAIACVSAALADDVAEVTGVPRGRLEVIPNGVARDEILPAAASPPPHAWLAESEPPVVLALGRLERVKGFDRLIEAVARVGGRRPVRLIVLGEGSERGRLEALARRLGVDSDVALPGYAENPYPYMAHAAVVALSSLREGLPTVLIEALALGRPVVATDCPTGPREILQGGRLGRLVPPGDVERLAVALEEALVAGPSIVPTEALARYDPERVADRYLALVGAAA